MFGTPSWRKTLRLGRWPRPPQSAPEPRLLAEKTDGSRDCAPAFTFIDHFVAAAEAAVGTRADALDAIRPAIRHALAWSLERERARAESRREWRALRKEIALLQG